MNYFDKISVRKERNKRMEVVSVVVGQIGDCNLLRAGCEANWVGKLTAHTFFCLYV